MEARRREHAHLQSVVVPSRGRVALVLLLADATDMTWGFSVAQTEFYPPHIYLAAVPDRVAGAILFGVTPMTMAAVTTTFVFSPIYYAVTGSYYFVDSHVPIAVFIGMNLLFTDPATSPRTFFGRILFRCALRAQRRSLVRLVAGREHARLLRQAAQVPLLNLSVIVLDRMARSPLLRPSIRRVWHATGAAQPSSGYMSVWAVAFGAMSASGELGDEHPGQWTPFWEQACAADTDVKPASTCTSCRRASARTAPLGVQRDRHHARGALRQSTRAASAFKRACTLQFAAGCDNAAVLARAGMFPMPDAPTLRRLSVSSCAAARARLGSRPARLYARACELGWPDTCGRT